MKKLRFFLFGLISLLIFSCQGPQVPTLWMIGDSTMADYANYGEDYMKERYPQMGWGQAFPEFLLRDSLKIILGAFYPISQWVFLGFLWLSRFRYLQVEGQRSCRPVVAAHHCAIWQGPD